MRVNVRFKIKSLTFFGMISKTQTLEGFSSKLDQNRHVILWDLENCTLKECEEALLKVQLKHELSTIYITSDKDKSYHAFCWTVIPFKEYLTILLETDYLDYNFFFWTVQRGASTIRTSNKKGRQPQKLVAVLESYDVKNPFISTGKIIKIKYDTGLEKKGVLLEGKI